MWQVYSCDDSEMAVTILSNFLNNILDKVAPIKITLGYQIHLKCQ